MGKTSEDIDLLISKTGIKYYSTLRNFNITACGIMVLGSSCGIYNICNITEPKDLPLYIFTSTACIIGSVVSGSAAYINNSMVKKLKKELESNS